MDGMSAYWQPIEARRVLLTSACTLTLMLAIAACAPAPEESGQQAAALQPDFNLEGTWKWFDRFELPTGCLIRMWQEGEKWNGWIVQDFEVEQECDRVEHRLDRAQLDGTRISLWFRDPDSQRFSRWELRLEIVAPTKLQSRTRKPPSTLVKVSG